MTFLKEVFDKKPKSFLEIGVFHGVTARNVCELLYQIHGNDFKYVGLDLFEKSDENKFEVIPSTNFKNPFKKFYHQYITRQDPYSIEAVSNLLKKFKDQVHLIKGNSNQVVKKMDMSKIDFVFLDGGHEYNTVVNDLNSCIDVLKFNGSILCDDYNLGSAPGVKKAIDEFVKNNNFKCKIFCDDRFALIEN
ncbi:class I SAM-dependent methyltransferase [Candidatus Pelagibacter bacterium nBUS_33]|uniref:class I SAM-dependent methyltransferase n=1 Tax=Candidatus Pelagibacter bacterium nBUS_33 TaxID=3374193 RepID=UPI003EB6ECCB